MPVILPSTQIHQGFRITKIDKPFELLSLPMAIKTSLKPVSAKIFQTVPSEFFLALCLKIHTAFPKGRLNNALFLHCKAE